MDKNALMETDLYDLFGIISTASIQELKKAYRKKALKCHPDKNPDNPNAAKLFLELSTALEILLDESSRATYDKQLTARQAAKIRHDALDSKRKKLKEDLEAREKSAATAAFRHDSRSQQTAEEKYNAEILRLRKEGSKQLLEEMEKVKEEIREQMANHLYGREADGSAHRLKVRWKSDKTDENNGGYNSSNLETIFSKYGKISCLIVSSKKKGSALLEFETKSAAIKAYQLERGYGSNQLKLSWLDDAAAAEATSLEKDSYRRCSPLDQCPTSGDLKGGGLFPSFQSSNASTVSQTSNNSSSVKTDEDFEAMVFAKMREAQQKKNSSAP